MTKLKKKNPTSNVGEDIGKEELFFTVSRVASLYNHSTSSSKGQK